MDSDFSNSKRIYPDKHRFLTKALFEQKFLNGEVMRRHYLVYSSSQGSVFCAPCKLFGGTSKFGTNGFNDWKHGNQRVIEHENSHSHRDCVLMFKRRGNVLCRIDSHLLSQIEEQVKYWRHVLHRVVTVVKQLSSRGLAFRGEDEVFGSVRNGNFMMCLELIAEYDPFLKAHIAQYGNLGKGKTSYLSFSTYEELIKIMAKTVTNAIVEEVKASKYFAVIVDSTPDITHNDQLSFVIRYVNKEGLPEERFLEFHRNSGHTGKELADALITFLSTHGIEINNCRGQTYDNAANMSGIYSGLQAKIKEENPLAFFIPCSAHSLNLVGSSAANCCKLAISFFELLQNLYNFFSTSTHRWNLLSSFFTSENLSLKTLSTTRWSARDEAYRSHY